jgi:hypothetical protein
MRHADSQIGCARHCNLAYRLRGTSGEYPISELYGHDAQLRYAGLCLSAKFLPRSIQFLPVGSVAIFDLLA